MSKIVKNPPSPLTLEGITGGTEAELKGRAALRPSINAMLVINAFKNNVMGKDVDMGLMLATLQDSMREVKNGNLTSLEAMLIGQATALQTVFTSLALRASSQERLSNYQAFMGLALKAQNQSRATIQSLVNLKYPRQATFVKQANIAHGPQQVNNRSFPKELSAQHTPTHGKEIELEQNKLLEADHGKLRQRMDTRATQKAERSYQAVETVESVQRTKKRRG
jgi:hypothetical protein